MIRPLDCFLVALGSAVGGVARYLLALVVTARTPSTFPWGIFVVNISGAFVIGLIMTLLTERYANGWSGWRLLLVVGFLGGFTTFSSLVYDSLRLSPCLGLLNLVGSGAAGYAAVWLGARLAVLIP